VPDETKPEKIVYKNEAGEAIIKSAPPANAPAGTPPAIEKAEVDSRLSNLRSRQIVNADLLLALEWLEGVEAHLKGYPELGSINGKALKAVQQAIIEIQAMSRKVMANDTTKADTDAPADVAKAEVRPLPAVEKKLDSTTTPRPASAVINTSVEKNEPAPVKAWDWGKIARLSINSSERNDSRR